MFSSTLTLAHWGRSCHYTHNHLYLVAGQGNRNVLRFTQMQPSLPGIFIQCGYIYDGNEPITFKDPGSNIRRERQAWEGEREQIYLSLTGKRIVCLSVIHSYYYTFYLQRP